jgi:hypothetical protein
MERQQCPNFYELLGLSVKGEVSISNPGTKCPLSQGFWKNNPSAWPVTSLKLGNQTYTLAQMLAIYATPVAGDATLILAHQLIAAKENIANGSNPLPVATTIEDADGLLGAFSGTLPYQVHPSSEAGRKMTNDANLLDTYNNDHLTPNCTN